MPEKALSPRKSPGQRRSATTVEAIVEAAARILEADGLARYTTNAVALRAGVSIGSLYQYFPGKDAITRALILREQAYLLADLSGVEHQPDGRARLDHLIDAAVRHQLRRPVLARLLDIEENRLPLDDEFVVISEQIAATVGQCLSSPDLPDTSHDRTAVNDVMAIVKGMVDAAGQRGEVAIDGLAHRARRAIWGYLWIDVPELRLSGHVGAP